mmetsp:Transcript_22133/g.33568  ORF Transcript_22133/g.33568 Transcript_22133/m.33568 type:complete len:467 (+) Transcript_22133:95-1495(+)
MMTIALCRTFILFLLFTAAASEEQIKWTANEDAENVALPLSLKQRRQLLQLQEAIQTSPNPNETLQQVAQSNNMQPEELVHMLEKNNRDLELNPSLVETVSIPKVVFKAFASLSILVSQFAKTHPNMFGLTTATLILMLYAAIIVPRTGLQISSNRSLLSKGPTTLFSPPKQHLERLADSPKFDKRSLSVHAMKTKWDDLFLNEDGVRIHKLPRKSELAQAVSCQVSILPDSFVTEEFPSEESEEGMNKEEKDENEEQHKTEILELLFENAANLLSNRQLTEFSSEKVLRAVFSPNQSKHGILVVPSLGDFGRYGLVYYKVTHQLESHRDATLTLTALKRMGFDGQVHCHIRKYQNKVVVTVHFIVRSRGRKLPKSLATFLVTGLANSLSTSSTQRTEQTLARQSQGKRYKSSSHRYATERRALKLNREKKLEEMAEDRRRKWQRSNPNSGRYQPTGDRQRSPNNC